MDVDEYLWFHRKTNAKLAEDMGLYPVQVSSLRRRKGSPSLLNALKLAYITQGKVSFEEMLSKADQQKWEKFIEKLGDRRE